MGYNSRSIAQLLHAYQNENLTCVQVVEDTLAAIHEKMDLGAYLHIEDSQKLLEQARSIDARRTSGEPLGALAGIPIAVKDNICTQGVPTTAASKILQGFTPPYDATVVQKLKQADAILIGKTNLDEFAMGSSNENSAYQNVKNPANTDYVPGGSSGGSAAAVAANLCAAALGSDTGGSIRQPASHCGVVGLKPTYGRVSRYGLIAFASSLDQIGPMTRTVEDAALVYEAIAGHDPMDMTSATASVDDFRASLQKGVQGLKVGVPREYFSPAELGLQPEVKERVEASLAFLEESGAELVDISLPHTQYAVATYYLIATAEASSNLARYDGVRYGHRAQDIEDLQDLYERSRAQGFGDEVKRRIMLGTFVLSAGFYDAYYLKAQKVRALIARDFVQAFEKVDVIVSPTAPTTAFAFGEKSKDPLQMYLEDIFTISCNLAGIAGLSIPAGADQNGLPIGVQLLAPAFGESTLFQVGHHLEGGLR